MTEALKLLIICMCLNCEQNTDNRDKLEYIHFYTDSIKVYDQKWMILSKSNIDTYGDKIHKGLYMIMNDTTKATITVAGRNVLFTIPSKDVNVRLYQIQHESEYYLKEDLNE